MNIIHSNVQKELSENGFVCCQNIGKSMMPLIRAGKDYMVIQSRTNHPLKKYDAVLFVKHEHQSSPYILHRILKINPDGTYWIVGDNCVDGDIVHDKDIIGILTEVIRSGKSIKVTDLKYKIYVHLWCDIYQLRFFVLKCIDLIKCMFFKLISLIKGENNGTNQ